MPGTVKIPHMADHYLKSELYALVESDPAIFEFLQAGSLDGIWYWDVTDPAQEWMSPKFKEVFGYSDDDIPDTSQWWQDNIHPGDLQVALDNFGAHLEDASHPYDQIVRYRHRDGSTVWVRCRGLAIRDENGRPQRMLGAHTNVTSLMEANELVERSNEQWRQFAAAVSHDIRTPIRHMLGAAEILEEELGPLDLPVDVSETLEVIKQSGLRLSQLINDLLSVASVVQTQQEQVTVDLNELVDGVFEDLGPDVKAGNATLTRDTLPTVKGTPAELTQVFTNVIENSLKYSDPGRGQRITISSHESANENIITIRDTGIGLDPSQGARLFEMFQRLQAPGAYSGTGIGLALVSQIMAKHRGSARIDPNNTAEGVGTAIELTFPVHRR